jgi:hypothetical protein
MDAAFSDRFLSRWRAYFADAELPICAFYADDVRKEDLRQSTSEHRFLIGNLNRVRDGFPFIYDANTHGCARHVRCLRPAPRAHGHADVRRARATIRADGAQHG